ncbi:hypothetical protein Tco_0718110, partial [Tanacetum coccineum]
PVGYLELPEADAISVQGGLPNYSHPSDHDADIDMDQPSDIKPES